MMRLWLLWPLLAASSLIGSAAWWDAEKNIWVSPAPLIPEVSRIPDMPLPPAVQVPVSRERPVFWSSRRVLKVVVKDTRQIDELSQARLLSVVQSGSQQIALLRKKDGSLLKFTSETEPWRLISFDGRLATFVGADGQRLDIPLVSGRGR